LILIASSHEIAAFHAVGKPAIPSKDPEVPTTIIRTLFQGPGALADGFSRRRWKMHKFMCTLTGFSNFALFGCEARPFFHILDEREIKGLRSEDRA